MQCAMSWLLFGHRNEILCIVPTISTIFCLSKCLMFKKVSNIWIPGLVMRYPSKFWTFAWKRWANVRSTRRTFEVLCRSIIQFASRRLPRRKTHCSNWERCNERCQMMLPRDRDILNSRQHSTWMVILHTVSMLSMYCSGVIRNNQNLWIWGLISKCSNSTRVKISTWYAVSNFFLEHSALKGPESSSYLGTFN
jgi:hypothetical protein